MRTICVLLSAGMLFACETMTVPAGRVTGIVVTPEGEPIANAFVDLYMSVPVGFEASPLEALGTARTRTDGTFEIDFPEKRILVNAGGRMWYGMHVLHPDWQAVTHGFWEISAEPTRSPLGPLAPGRDYVADDCQELCGSRNRLQCREISKEYFGSEDACDSRY